MQAIARQLQAEVSANCDPVLDQLLRHWSDSTDIGIVEEVLKMAASGESKDAVQKALANLRSTSRPTRQERGTGSQQRTLESVWREMMLPPGDGTDWTQEHEDPDTLGVRTQLLGLQEAWPGLEQANRRTILDAILNVLPRDRVRQQAARIAQIYNQIGDQETPQTIVALRVALRKRRSVEDDHKGATGRLKVVSEDTDEESKGVESCTFEQGKATRSKRLKMEQPDKPKVKPRPTQVDHEAATQQYNPPQRPAVHGRPSSVAEYDASTQDERETERRARQQWQEEYSRMEEEDQAEARYLAEWQEELEVESAWEAFERASGQSMAPTTHPDTANEHEHEEWGDSD